MAYTEEQEMLSLAFLSYLGFYETTFGMQTSDRTYSEIDKGLKKSPCTAGEWELVWGPAMYRMPLTVFDENVMYMVRSLRDRSRYAIAIRGTNPLSVTNWLLQDFNVFLQTPWPYGRSAEHPDAKLSKGTARGLQALQDIKPARGVPGEGLSLYQFLSREVASHHSGRLTVLVTGHSLGGALAPATALWLADTQQVSDQPESPPWDPALRATIKVYAFAGPSPGNAAFAAYYDSRLGANTRRIWNQYDVVPHGWTLDALQKLPDLYSPKIRPDLLMSLVLWSTHVLARNGNYRQILEKSESLTDAQLFPLAIDYVGQMVYQHTMAYPQLLGMLHEIDPLVHFELPPKISHILHRSRSQHIAEKQAATPEVRSMGDLAGPTRSLSQRVSAASKLLHRAYRVPATLLLAACPEAQALKKLMHRRRCFHARRGNVPPPASHVAQAAAE